MLKKHQKQPFRAAVLLALVLVAACKSSSEPEATSARAGSSAPRDSEARDHDTDATGGSNEAFSDHAPEDVGSAADGGTMDADVGAEPDASTSGGAGAAGAAGASGTASPASARAGSGAAGAAGGGSIDFPTTLDATGLYVDASHQAIAAGVEAYEPEFALWSDGATKQRWLYLPPGTQIDTSDMDAWVFPVGTKVWKEFTRDGKRVETRLLQKFADRWFMMSYAWDTTQTQAPVAPDGKKNVLGTTHDIPNAADCGSCHDGSVDKLLGVSAIQLSHDRPGLNLTSLIATARLTQAPSGNFVVPGDATTRAALGALHANCGGCHNPHGIGLDRAKDLLLWLTIDGLAQPEDTTVYRTTIGQPMLSKEIAGMSTIVVPGSPDQSGLLFRQSAVRTDELTMPPLASELPDTATSTAVRAWITSLSP